jgi:hypothetical protein
MVWSIGKEHTRAAAAGRLIAIPANTPKAKAASVQAVKATPGRSKIAGVIILPSGAAARE